nr:unnamed protein product [Callosobruchus chinensis]
MSKDHTAPFTVTVEAVIEARPFYPECFSTPNSVSSESKVALDKEKKKYSDDQENYTTSTKSKSTTLERAIENVNAILKVEAPISQCDVTNDMYENLKTKDEVDEKFVVNLFESRPSKRWQRRYLSPKIFEKEHIQLERGHVGRYSKKKQQPKRSVSILFIFTSRYLTVDNISYLTQQLVLITRFFES